MEAYPWHVVPSLGIRKLCKYKCITHAPYCRVLAFSPFWEEVSQSHSLCILNCNIETDFTFKGAGTQYIHKTKYHLFTVAYVYMPSDEAPSARHQLQSRHWLVTSGQHWYCMPRICSTNMYICLNGLCAM